MDRLGDAIFWFAVAGAGVAGVRHMTSTLPIVSELTPIAISRGEKPNDDSSLSPGIRWWAGYAFSCMNLGFCSIGLYAGLSADSLVAKRAFLLGTAVMFVAFAFAWFTKGGEITGNLNFVRQSVKIGAFGILFFLGFLFI